MAWLNDLLPQPTRVTPAAVAAAATCDVALLLRSVVRGFRRNVVLYLFCTSYDLQVTRLEFIIIIVWHERTSSSLGLAHRDTYSIEHFYDIHTLHASFLGCDPVIP